MIELRFKRRRAPLRSLTRIMAAQYAFLAYLWLAAIHDTRRWPPGSGTRIVVPLLAITGYWLLACFFNLRISVVRPSGRSNHAFPLSHRRRPQYPPR